MIAIIDYGMGNLGSIANMLKKIGHRSIITNSKSEIDKADKIILPGVGAFDAAMNNLAKLDLITFIVDQIYAKNKPLLGICLGMQLLCRKSEEGEKEGFGFIQADVKLFQYKDYSLKIPHMGWNYIKTNIKHPLLVDLPTAPRFYFVHSYHAICDRTENVMTWTDYGYDFASSIISENVMGVQFHPEKSHKFGMKLLSNFVENF